MVVKALQTKPPARYNEATLLSAMEGAGKMVDDEELRAAMAGAASARRPRARRSSRT
jgi:DNA topoisomerase-3